jgi:hypothetical protein
MARIGSFAAEVRKDVPTGERDTFDLHDETFTLRWAGEISDITIMQLASTDDSDTSEEAQRENFGAFLAFFKDVLVDGEWPRFVKVCRDNAVSGSDLARICAVIVPAVWNRPTNGRSVSLDGPPSTMSSSVRSYAPPTRVSEGGEVVVIPDSLAGAVTAEMSPPPVVRNGHRVDPHFGTEFTTVDELVSELGTRPGPS